MRIFPSWMEPPEEMLEFINLVIQNNNDPVSAFLNGVWKGEKHD